MADRQAEQNRQAGQDSRQVGRQAGGSEEERRMMSDTGKNPNRTKIQKFTGEQKTIRVL